MEYSLAIKEILKKYSLKVLENNSFLCGLLFDYVGSDFSSVSLVKHLHKLNRDGLVFRLFELDDESKVQFNLESTSNKLKTEGDKIEFNKLVNPIYEFKFNKLYKKIEVDNNKAIVVHKRVEKDESIKSKHASLSNNKVVLFVKNNILNNNQPKDIATVVKGITDITINAVCRDIEIIVEKRDSIKIVNTFTNQELPVNYNLINGGNFVLNLSNSDNSYKLYLPKNKYSCVSINASNTNVHISSQYKLNTKSFRFNSVTTDSQLNLISDYVSINSKGNIDLNGRIGGCNIVGNDLKLDFHLEKSNYNNPLYKIIINNGRLRFYSPNILDELTLYEKLGINQIIKRYKTSIGYMNLDFIVNNGKIKISN